MQDLKREWITDAPVAGGFVVGWLFSDKDAGRNRLLTELKGGDLTSELVENWLLEIGQDPDRNGYATAYSEGFKNALTRVLHKIDEHRRQARLPL